MKILFINTGTIYQNAGIIRCLALGEELVKIGHDVNILINNHPENLKAYGYEFKGIKFIYSKSGSIAEQIDKLIQIRTLKNLDYIHCMGVGTSIYFPALIYKKIFSKSVKLIVDFEDRQVLLTPAKRRVLMLFLEKLGVDTADKVICASQSLATYLHQKYKIKLPYYIPFAISERTTIVKEELSNNESFTIGYIGNLIQLYRDQVIKLFQLIALAQESGRNLQLAIGGKGNYEAELKRLVLDYKIEENVRFLGFIPDDEIQLFFSRVDVLVLYLPETDLNRYRCPNKAFLYASSGLPIVSSKFGEVENLLKDYSKNVFFENSKSSATSLLEKINEAVDIKEPVSDVFYERNSWKVRAQQYLKIIESDENIN